MSSPVYPTIRPSAEPPAPGLRAVLAYLWSERLLGTIGDNGDDHTMAFIAVLGTKPEMPDASARRAYGRAVYDVLGSEVECPAYREGAPPEWRDVYELSIDYNPTVYFQAIAGLYVAAGHKPPRNYPMKTSTRLAEDHVNVRAGYGAKPERYYPLADGRVLVVHGPVVLSPALAEALGGYPDGTFPGVSFMDDATGALFYWPDYLGVLGVDAGPRYNPQPGDKLKCSGDGTVWTVTARDGDDVDVSYHTPSDNTGDAEWTVAMWSEDSAQVATWTRPDVDAATGVGAP